MPWFKFNHSYRGLLFVILISLASTVSNAQRFERIDSLKSILNDITLPDSVRTTILWYVMMEYRPISPDSSILYGQQAYDLAEKIHSISRQINAAGFLSFAYYESGNLPKALDIALKSYQFAKDNNAEKHASASVTNIGYIYLKLEDYPKALHYFRLQASIGGPGGRFAKEHLAEVFLAMNVLDSASYYANGSLEDYNKRKEQGVGVYAVLGDVARKLGDNTKAIEYYYTGLLISKNRNSIRDLAKYKIRIAQLYMESNQLDSSIYYAKSALEESQGHFKQNMLDATLILSNIYESLDAKQALSYYKTTTKLNEEIIGAGNIKTIQNIISLAEEKDRKIDEAKKEYQRQLKQYGFIVGLLILLLIAYGQYRNNKRKQTANALLLRQKEEIQLALTQLKSTQSQLIQSEKMASLGELTAGIAHEIQNPLNFVNNFSEVNTELIAELKAESVKPKADWDDSLIKETLDNLNHNEQKINHHGKRAADIVKGMLQHSQSSSGKKESTDINALADEYVRLAYHGLRAKDKSFNATMNTDYDQTIGNINIIPQDIGRVILNVINNSFYAVNEKATLRQAQGDTHYDPTVSVSTKKEGNKVLISVKDNGNGIPQKILDKIFQPFFTTKPTGQGTGLGLSLSYDIVKAHGGELRVETKEGVGSEFVVMLPQ